MKITPKKCQRYKEMMKLYAEGKGYKQVADHFGVDRKTEYTWRKELEEGFNKSVYNSSDYFVLLKEVIDNHKKIQKINDVWLDHRIENCRKSGDLAELESISSSAAIYNYSFANLVGKLKIVNIQSLLKEMDDQEEEIEKIKIIAWKLHDNNLALREGDPEPYLDIVDNIDLHLDTPKFPNFPSCSQRYRDDEKKSKRRSWKVKKGNYHMI